MNAHTTAPAMAHDLETRASNRQAFANALERWKRRTAALAAMPVEMLDDNADEVDDLVDATVEAARQLIAIPAHCLTDLRAKLEVMFDDLSTRVEGGELDSVFADLRAMTHGESPTFNAKAWAIELHRAGGGLIKSGNADVFLYPEGRHGQALEWQVATRGAKAAAVAAFAALQHGREA